MNQSQNIYNSPATSQATGFIPLMLKLTERGWLPDSVLRFGIRHLLGKRRLEIHADNPDAAADD